MNTTIINTHIKIMAAQAAILSESTETDPKTSVYFEGKKAGFEMLQDKNETQVVFARDHAQAEAIRHRTELSDLLKYQYFEGIAAAATEVLGLYFINP
jgi:hypothetical protein